MTILGRTLVDYHMTLDPVLKLKRLTINNICKNVRLNKKGQGLTLAYVMKKSWISDLRRLEFVSHCYSCF